MFMDSNMREKIAEEIVDKLYKYRYYISLTATVLTFAFYIFIAIGIWYVVGLPILSFWNKFFIFASIILGIIQVVIFFMVLADNPTDDEVKFAFFPLWFLFLWLLGFRFEKLVHNLWSGIFQNSIVDTLLLKESEKRNEEMEKNEGKYLDLYRRNIADWLLENNDVDDKEKLEREMRFVLAFQQGWLEADTEYLLEIGKARANANRNPNQSLRIDS